MSVLSSGRIHQEAFTDDWMSIMGTKLVLQGTAVADPVQPGLTPETAGPVVSGLMDTSRVWPHVGSIDSVRQEVDDAFADMKTFHNLEPDQVMRLCGGHSARLSEIRVQIQRIEVVARQWKPVRTNEVEVAIEELKQQYLIASRLHSVRELDFKLAGGMT